MKLPITTCNSHNVGNEGPRMVQPIVAKNREIMESFDMINTELYRFVTNLEAQKQPPQIKPVGVLLLFMS